MHIPDGVLSPSTSAVVGVAMLPVWAIAGRQVRKSLGTRQIPMLALGAAFCFSIMMFNIPALGGTTAHPVAGTLLAVLLGPWAALIGISVALAIQALFFADGGLLAYGPNCFTMAFVLPFVGYSVYRLLAQRAPATSPLRALAAGIGAYIGLNAAAAMVALLLGIQPVLFHEPNGHALYFPFGLKITLPAMLGTHLLIAGPAEAIVTALVVRYLTAAGHILYGMSGIGYRVLGVGEESVGSLGKENEQANRKDGRREGLWIGLLALVALSPLGLLAKGDAWGEWDAEGVRQQIKKAEGREYTPAGLARTQAHAYQGIRGLGDYAQPEQGRNGLGYIISAALGVTAISIILLLLGRLLSSRYPTPDTRYPSSLTSEHLNTRAPSSSLPAWLLSSAEPVPTAAGPPTRPSNRYLERTLAEITEGAATALYGERWARQSGYLQRLDARAKVVGFFALILVAACLRQPVTLLALYLLTLLLAAVSHLPIGALSRRVWLSVPLFVGALALPIVLNVVTPGYPVLVLMHRPYLAITAPGLAGAGLLMLRIGVAVSLAALLTMTTGWNDLLRALRALLVPRLFLSVLAMTYRYLALLLQTSAEMFVARRSRTVGRQSNAEGRRFMGTSVGALYGKTLALTEEVHAAMLSRGFGLNGEMRTLTRLRWRAVDSVWVLAVTLLSLLALGGEHARYF